MANVCDEEHPYTPSWTYVDLSMTAMSHSFSFATYLCTLLELSSASLISIEPLDGGLTNHTARAIFHEPIYFPSSTAAMLSVIVKHAPPYIASLGPAHALSTKRQDIEAHVLELFAGAHEHAIELRLSDVARRHPDIRIPEILYHDKQNNVLIMSDLGRIPTLLDHLRSHSRAHALQSAAVLGHFLADLYCSTRGASDDMFRPLDNEEGSRAIRELIASLPGKLLKSAAVPDAETLGRSVEQDMISDKQDRCFGMVDLWPGSILIGNDFVGLVDWEYAGKSSAGSELGMLTAHLHLSLLSPHTSPDQSSIISSFTTEFLSAFAARSPTRSQEFVRSALLSHGRELINAVEFQQVDLAGDHHKAALIQCGARCLRAAACENSALIANMLGEDERFLLRDLV